MKKKITKKKRVKVKTNQFLSWSSIGKSLEDLKNDGERIGYLQKVINKPEFLRKSVIKKTEELLGDFYVMNGYERKAGKLFKLAGNKEMAKECYQASNFFNKRDERLLEKKQEELKNLEGKK